MTEEELNQKLKSTSNNLVAILHEETNFFPISWNKKKAIVNFLKDRINKCKAALLKTVQILSKILEENEEAVEDALRDQTIDEETGSMLLKSLEDEFSNDLESIYEESFIRMEDNYSVISQSYNNYYSNYVPYNFSQNIWTTPFITQEQIMFFTGEVASNNNCAS